MTVIFRMQKSTGNGVFADFVTVGSTSSRQSSIIVGIIQSGSVFATQTTSIY